MKFLLFPFFLLFSIVTVTKAQVAIFKSVAFIDSVSQPGTNKYGFKFSFDGINVPIIYKLTNTSNTYIRYGDSIPNVINDSIEIMPDIWNKFYFVYALNANNTSQIVGRINVHPASKNLTTFTQLIEPTTSICNGIISVHRTLSPDITFTDSAKYSYPGVSGNMLYGTVNNLCSRKYQISASYYLTTSYNGFGYGNHMQEQFIVYLGPDEFPANSNLDFNVNSYQQAGTPNCDGKAKVNLIYSASACMFSFDGSPYLNTDSITNLCEGIHFAKVKNATDTVEKYFVVSNTNSVINNPNPYGPVIDTVIYNYTNCNFNYNLPIDSAFIVNYNFIDTNTVFVSWQIWQGGILSSVSDTISYNYQSGNNMVSLMIFCGNAKTLNTNSIKTFRINDYILLNQSVEIKENLKKMDIELFPNPFSSSISIKSKSIVDIKSIEMFNLLGELLSVNYQINDKEIVLDTDNLKSGFYTISIISKSGQKTTYKVIKQ